jgi:hypothetical protein
MWRMFVKRLGPSERSITPLCQSTFGCPDIWELDNGDFAVIGADITEHADKLPPTAGCAPNERMVRIPRTLLIHAKAHIPDPA